MTGLHPQRTDRAAEAAGTHDADAVLIDLGAKLGAVARRNRIAGVENDLAFQRITVLVADLRQRGVRHGDQHDVAERDRLLHAARTCERAELATMSLSSSGCRDENITG